MWTSPSRRGSASRPRWGAPPARSRWAGPSGPPGSPPWAIVLRGGQAATQKRWPPQVQWMTTSPLYQPLMLLAVVAAPLMLGAVLSILVPLTAAVAALPALSATVTGPAPRLVPSPPMTLTAGQLPSTPESASLQTHCTATSPLYQPFVFAAG